jgi:hypothetical protein
MDRIVINAALKCLMTAWGVALCTDAFSARFPNAVERKIVLTGQAAISLAQLFGFEASATSSATLRLDRNAAWAVYLLKQDTKEPLSNDNEGSPARYDVVEFSPSPVPSMTISPYWLDLGTRAPESDVGSYSFASWFLREDLPGGDAWTQLVKRLKTVPDWKDAGDTAFERCFTSRERVELCVSVTL